MSTNTETRSSTDPIPVSVNQAVDPNDKPLTIAVVDQTHDVEAAAKDYAEARLREESEAAREAGRIKGFLHRIWRGENGIATKYFFNKYVEEAKHRAEEEGLTVLYTDSVELRNAAMGATIARFTSEYDESIHEVAGERRQELAEDSPFGLAVKKLIENYVEGDSKDWSEEAFREAQSRIVRQLDQYGDGDDLIGEGKVRIDNIWQIAQAVKESVNHGESLDNVLQGMKIYTGESRSGVRTEAHQSKIDKTIERLQKSKIGSLVGPETISLGAAIATGLFRVGRGSLMRAAGVTGIPGLLGGVFAGMRENKRLKEERAIHAREVAQGQEFEDKGRRAEIEKTRYETVAAKELIGSLEEFIDKEDLSPEELQQCYESIVNATSRIYASDKSQADFISYSSVTEVELERFELDVAIARAKVKLEGRLGDLPEALVADLGIDKGGTVDDAIYKSTDVLYSLMDDRSKKDEAFKKLKRRRVAIAAATGAVTGFTIGLASQEALAFFGSGYDGLLENVLTGEGGGDRQTLLAGIFHGEGYGYNTETIVSAGDYTSYDVGGSQGSINLPDNYQLTYNPDGTTNIIDPNGNVFAENISFEADGSLSQASQELLQEKGAIVEDLSTVVSSQESTMQDLGVNEYLDHHHSDLTNITRDFWYDNDTASVFDNNELGLQWGSQGDDGSIRLSISNMTDYGSYHGFDSASWSNEAQGGTLKFAVSASIDSQDRVFMVDIAPDGSIDIPSDSPAANLFSVDKYGQVEFNGAYGEVVAIQDVDTDGITHVAPLATMEGNNSVSTISTTVEVLADKNVPKFQITPPSIETVVNAAPTVEGFGGPAVVLRRPLERLNKKEDPFTYNYYGYGENRDLQWMRKWVSDMGGPRTRRQVKDASGKEHWVEADNSPVVRSVERERNTIYNYLNSEFSKNPEYKQKVASVMSSLGAMSSNCRVSVNIPAWMEADNLDRLLSQYIDQTDNKGEALEQSLFEINILVNRKKGTPEDNSVKVIESFTEKYAKRHNGARPVVHYANVEMEPEEANIGFVRKLLTDAVLQRSLDRNNQSQPLYIESEDADLIEVDKRTVFNLISKLDKNPHLDAVHGIEGRMSSIIKDNALLLMRRNAWEVLLFNARQKRFRDPRNPNWNSFSNRVITGGWNSGYSAEAYAMIGGYEPARAGEDISIGERISMMRGDGDYPNLETIGSVPTRTESSPRRFIDEIANKKSAYEDFGDDDNEEAIRGVSLSDAMKRIDEYADITEDNKPNFENEAQMYYDWARGSTPTLGDARDVARRIMRSVGYEEGDYVFEGDKIHIVNWDNVKRNIEDYRRGFTSAKNPNRKIVIGGW
jgi:hypothetical protein